jgi:cytochrome c-type biogenesis protein CcmE
MTRKRRRLMLLGLAALGLCTASALALSAFQDNLLFFYSPSELHAGKVAEGQRFRLGGLVVKGSLQHLPDGQTITFTVTDTAYDVAVRYGGIVPDLFREGQGVVAHGRVAADGTFMADELLAKHDEKYMPPEVAKALQDAGHPSAPGASGKPAVSADATPTNAAAPANAMVAQ